MRIEGLAAVAALLPFVSSCARSLEPEGSRETGSPSGLVLELSLSEPGEASRSPALTLRIRNPTSDRLSLPEPSPLSPGVGVADGTTLLGLSLREDAGAVSYHEPVLTRPAPLPGAVPRRITLEPGEEWSHSYPLDLFYFWGPCGPATSLAESFEVDGGRKVSVAARISDRTGLQYQSNFLALESRVGDWAFRAPEIAPDVETLNDLLGLQGRAPPIEIPADVSAGGEAIVRDLRSPMLDTRLGAVFALSNLPAERRKQGLGTILPLLVDYLDRASDDRDRLAALHALESVDDAAREAEPSIERALEAEHFLVRAKARRLLERLRGRPVAHDGPAEVYAGKTADEWIAGLGKSNQSPDDVFADLQAMESLTRMGDVAIPKLLEALDGDNLKSARMCGKVLRRLYGEGTLNETMINEALRTAGPAVRRRLVGVVSSPFPSHPESEKIRKGSAAILIRLLGDEDTEVRSQAANALGREDFTGALSHLVAALDDSEAIVRQAAARSIGAVGRPTPEIFEKLRRATRDGDTLVRARARRALVALGDAAARRDTLLDAARTVHERALAERAIERVVESRLPVPLTAVDGIFFVVDRSGSSSPGVELARRLHRRWRTHVSGSRFRGLRRRSPRDRAGDERLRLRASRARSRSATRRQRALALLPGERQRRHLHSRRLAREPRARGAMT